MFRKENVQYYIGAAVGVTVGICVGKLLSSDTSSIVIQNNIQYHPNTSDIKDAPACRSIRKMLKPDDVSTLNKCHSRSKSVPRCSEKNLEDSPRLMVKPLVKPALSDSNINIDTKRPVKEVKLFKTLPTCESYQIVDEEKCLSQCQNTETYFLNNIKEKIHNSTVYIRENTISNPTLKSDLSNVKKIESIPGTTESTEYLSDSFENISLYINSNIATCNTIVDVKQVTSIFNDSESSDINYDECDLISSTKRDISIPF